MVSINYYAELAVALTRLFLIFLGFILCIDIMNKSSGRLRKAFIYFLVSLIPSVFYTVGRILNIESMFASGKLISLTFNTLTTAFILLGLREISKMVGELSNPSAKKSNKSPRKIKKRKVNKEVNIRSIIKRGKR
jgi:hypothetical protein